MEGWSEFLAIPRAVVLLGVFFLAVAGVAYFIYTLIRDRHE